MNYRYTLSALSLLAVLLSLPVEAKTEYTKVYEKSYSLPADGRVDVENMHGHVQIDMWDRNEVSFKVTVVVDASSESKAEDVFERVEISFNNSGGTASAKTFIESGKSTWWFISSWFDSNDDLEVNYEVKIPRQANLELSHKYGDAHVGNVGGNLVMEMKYGDFVVDDVSGRLEMHASYGNGVIAKAGRAEVDVAYFKLQMGEVADLDLDSKYSKVEVDKADRVNSETAYDQITLGTIASFDNEGKYDKIRIREVSDLELYTKYTKIEVEILHTAADANLSYGGIEIDQLGNEFRSVTINSRYAGIEIDAYGVPSYKLRVDTKYTSVDLPSGLNMSRDQKDNNSRFVEGHKGSSSATASISVDAEYGGFKLR